MEIANSIFLSLKLFFRSIPYLLFSNAVLVSLGVAIESFVAIGSDNKAKTSLGTALFLIFIFKNTFNARLSKKLLHKEKMNIFKLFWVAIKKMPALIYTYIIISLIPTVFVGLIFFVLPFLLPMLPYIVVMAGLFYFLIVFFAIIIASNSSTIGISAVRECISLRMPILKYQASLIVLVIATFLVAKHFLQNIKIEFLPPMHPFVGVALIIFIPLLLMDLFIYTQIGGYFNISGENR